MDIILNGVKVSERMEVDSWLPANHKSFKQEKHPLLIYFQLQRILHRLTDWLYIGMVSKSIFFFFNFTGIERLAKFSGKVFIQYKLFIYKEQKINIQDMLSARSRFGNSKRINKSSYHSEICIIQLAK